VGSKGQTSPKHGVNAIVTPLFFARQWWLSAAGLGVKLECEGDGGVELTYMAPRSRDESASEGSYEFCAMATRNPWSFVGTCFGSGMTKGMDPIGGPHESAEEKEVRHVGERIWAAGPTMLAREKEYASAGERLTSPVHMSAPVGKVGLRE
jgi:hypothetical protein